MKETWLRFRESDYLVSNDGRVLSLKKKKISILKPGVDKDGYLRVDLCFGSRGKVFHFHIHRLVAELFIPNPDNKQQVNHKDGIKQNNNTYNLEWVTPKENSQHAHAMGLSIGKKGSQQNHAKLHETQVLEIRGLLSKGSHSHKQLSEMYNISRSIISEIGARKIWTHI